MLPDEEGLPPYDGPFVAIELDGPSYCGEGSRRAYGSKHEAFGAARDLWTRRGLPVMDKTDPKKGLRT